MTAESGQTSRSIFTSREIALITSVLDRIIPTDERLPGAGELGVADYIDRVVADSAELKGLFTHGLAQIEITVHARYSEGFIDLPVEMKDAVLTDVESDEPEFFEALIRHTYNGYYSNPKVIPILGLEARPPQPRGLVLEAGNLGLIENVKKRGANLPGGLIG